MIKFENTEVTGWEAAIRGMRNPMNSWDKSDSGYGCNPDNFGPYTRLCSDCTLDYSKCGMHHHYIIGPNDLKLMKSLVRAGSDHSKFMRMINVTVDITAPMYWWKEFDTYKVGTVRNSCSTMHKIMDKEFELSDFSFENVDDTVSNLYPIMGRLNYARKKYLETKDKKFWYSVIQLLPSSYNQRSTVQLNYAVLRNMYHSRKNHKLDEWSVDFCNWVKTLPYSELIIDDFKGAIMNVDKFNYAALDMKDSKASEQK